MSDSYSAEIAWIGGGINSKCIRYDSTNNDVVCEILVVSETV